MPEGDTYAHAAARVSPVLKGRRIRRVEGSAPAVRRRSAALLDQRVVDVRTHGKHLIVDLESGFSVHIHLGMSGRVAVSSPGRHTGRAGHAARLVMTTDRGTVSVLSAPTVEVDRKRVIDHSLRHLGPDVLAPEFDFERFRSLAELFPGDRTVADLLLDQRVLSGVGNEYKSEVLFLERIAPSRLVSALAPGTLELLAERAREVMAPNAHRLVRSTTGRQDGGLWVYGRAGSPCRRCRTPVSAEWIGQPPRITYWCPRCQT